MSKVEAEQPETANETIEKMQGFTSLNRLFEMNPKRLTDDELRLYVDEQRKRRAVFYDKRS